MKATLAHDLLSCSWHQCVALDTDLFLPKRYISFSVLKEPKFYLHLDFI